MEDTEYIWQNGKLTPWKEANVHVMSHVLLYASFVFEGIRVYDTKSGPELLCLGGHLRRLYDSACIYRMEMPLSQTELEVVCH